MKITIAIALMISKIKAKIANNKLHVMMIFV